MTVGDSSILIAEAVAGRSLSEIATAAGVSISTVQRRLRDPAIVTAIRETRAQHRQERVGQLNILGVDAIRKLAQLIQHEEATVSLRAIALVLGNSIKLEGVVDVEERLSALESAADHEREAESAAEHAREVGEGDVVG
jgi:AcrR family transcriptional regulator